MNLILLEAGEVDDDGVARVAGVRADHIIRVLKGAPADSVRVGIVDGAAGHGIITAIRNGAVELRCTFETALPQRPAVDLLLALPRPKVMRRLWAQLAALGVGQIMLTNAHRVERNYFDSHILGEAVFRPLLLEGLQQARDTRLPAVSIHRQLKVLVEDQLDTRFPHGLRVVSHPAVQQGVASLVRKRPGARVLLAVGPEGGWTPYELELLAAHGFEAAGAGLRTLRTDTACVALLALVHDALSSE